MKWWNDIWLNEGFATWAEAKIVDQWRPAFGATLGQIAGLERVMDTDALRSARAVREPVRSTSEAMEAFDGITYQKGAAVLRMIESWLGADVFQRGVQRYVHENAWKNASADDLFKALDFVSTQKVEQLASGFLDHPGVPQVLASWKCEGANAGKLELRQSEWHRSAGPTSRPRDRRSWTLPVCVAIDGQKSRRAASRSAGDPIAREPERAVVPGLGLSERQSGRLLQVPRRTRQAVRARACREPLPRPDRAPRSRLERLGGRASGGDCAGRSSRLSSRSSTAKAIDTWSSEIIDVLRGVDQALVDDEARDGLREVRPGPTRRAQAGPRLVAPERPRRGRR